MCQQACRCYSTGDIVACLAAIWVKRGMQNALKLGSEAHRELLCRSFIVIHWEFDPEKLPWPDLNGQRSAACVDSLSASRPLPRRSRLASRSLPMPRRYVIPSSARRLPCKGARTSGTRPCAPPCSHGMMCAHQSGHPRSWPSIWNGPLPIAAMANVMYHFLLRLRIIRGRTAVWLLPKTLAGCR
jgi:hypothetical protein